MPSAWFLADCKCTSCGFEGSNVFPINIDPNRLECEECGECTLRVSRYIDYEGSGPAHDITIEETEWNDIGREDA